MLFKSLVVAAVLIATPALAASGETQDRYALDVSVFRDGVQVIGGHTLIVEEKQAEMSLTDGDLRYELNADLNPVQGDGEDALLSLNVNISHGDDQPQFPNLMLRRGGTARIEIGEKDASGAMTDGFTLTLTPIVPAIP
ncbi:MAG: hypothetical protein JWR59_1187 [Brevundimonas sp.]|nr:hypothetical protein [Brevundimonas sp.]